MIEGAAKPLLSWAEGAVTKMPSAVPAGQKRLSGHAAAAGTICQ